MASNIGMIIEGFKGLATQALECGSQALTVAADKAAIVAQHTFAALSSFYETASATWAAKAPEVMAFANENAHILGGAIVGLLAMKAIHYLWTKPAQPAQV